VVKTAREQGAPASSYDERTERFLSTYEKFKPTQEHELVILNCGGRPIAQSVLPRQIEYYGHGWDNGAYQFAANALDCDLLVCCNAGAYFHREGWLYPLVSARREYGPGLYGVSASYERGPHLRTPFIAFSPELLRDYPIAVKDREACNQFEAGPNSFTSYALSKNVPTFLMTWDAAYELKDWRRPDLQNIFRRGDQSNVMVWDRHTEIYNDSTSTERARLERYADTR
jgi:hypothetical protein